jgi:hypothetical protein
MEQSKMEQIMELLKSHNEEMMAGLKRLNATADAWLEKTEAFLEKKEPAPKEIKAVAEPQEVPEGATGEETIGTAKDRCRDLRLAVGCRRQLKTRTKRNGRVRQEYAATVGRPTRRTVPAMRKGGLRKGPGKKCRSGIRGPGRTLGSRMEDRSLKQRRTKDNVIRGTSKEWTRPVFKNGVRDRGARQSMLMRNGRRLYEALWQKFEPEAVKIAAESSIRLRDRGTGYCGSVGPRRSGRGSAIAAPQGPTAKDNGRAVLRREQWEQLMAEKS